MQIASENSSIVIIARDFNISIFKPPWLLKNNIFSEHELGGNILITPPAVQIPTQNFEFVALPDRIQMYFKKPYLTVDSDINRVLGTIIKTLPHTPYTGIGLNFNYLFAPSDPLSFSAWNRKLFVAPLASKISASKEQNARFGSFMSFDVLETKLKVDIKPVKATDIIEHLNKSWHSGQELMRVNFNFHNEVASAATPSDAILSNLCNWSKALSLSREFIDTLAKLEI